MDWAMKTLLNKLGISKWTFSTFSIKTRADNNFPRHSYQLLWSKLRYEIAGEYRVCFFFTNVSASLLFKA